MTSTAPVVPPTFPNMYDATFGSFKLILLLETATKGVVVGYVGASDPSNPIATSSSSWNIPVYIKHEGGVTLQN